MYAWLPRTRHTWYKDVIGQHLMAYMVVFAITLDLSAVAIITGTTRQEDWFAWLRVILFSIGFPIVLLWRDVIIYRGGRKQREQDNEGSTEKARSVPSNVVSCTPEGSGSSVGGGASDVPSGQ